MKKINLIFVIFILISSNAFSQEICIQLEGISIGCVPSESHVCYRNKNLEVDGGSGNCKYTKLEMTGTHYTAPAGAIAFECAAPPVIETTCVKQPGSDSQVCTTTSTCKEWSNPVCQEICILCHKEEKEEPKTAVGCIVCTRPACEEEKKAPPSAFCPAISKVDPQFVIPKVKRPLCGGRRCDLTATDPNGISHNVTVITQNCPPLEMVEKGDGGPKGPSCPWIVDPISGINNDSKPADVAAACAAAFPIKEPNRFPEDWTPPK